SSFFFSSRRRHTRSKRDWSSDVCSSDLRHSWKSPTCSSTVSCLRPMSCPTGTTTSVSTPCCTKTSKTSSTVSHATLTQWPYCRQQSPHCPRSTQIHWIHLTKNRSTSRPFV